MIYVTRKLSVLVLKGGETVEGQRKGGKKEDRRVESKAGLVKSVKVKSHKSTQQFIPMNL